MDKLFYLPSAKPFAAYTTSEGLLSCVFFNEITTRKGARVTHGHVDGG